MSKRWNYSWRAFAGDVCGGAVAALIALPYGLAMALLMGLPPVLGLFTSVVTAPITALLGRNPVLIGGTASGTVPFIAAAVEQHGTGGSAKLSVVAAVFMMVFSLLRWGRYMNRVPLPVVSGFSCGIGAMMVIGQLRTLLGVTPLPSSGSGSPVGQLIDAIGQMGAARVAPVTLGLVVIATAFLVTRRIPRAPAPLIGIVAALLVNQIFALRAREVGTLPLSAPPMAGFLWSPEDIFTLVPSALALAVVTSANILITSRVVDHFRGKRTAQADGDLGAYGIANLFAGIFGAPVSAGIPARSIANVRSGGTTRMSNLIHALFLLMFVALGSEFVSHIPNAALAGVTAYIGICLLDWRSWLRLPQMRRIDAVGFVTTVISVLLFNPAVALLMGSVAYMAEWSCRKLIVWRQSLALGLKDAAAAAVTAARDR